MIDKSPTLTDFNSMPFKLRLFPELHYCSVFLKCKILLSSLEFKQTKQSKKNRKRGEKGRKGEKRI